VGRVRVLRGGSSRGGLMQRIFGELGFWSIQLVRQAGVMALLLLDVLKWMLRPPYRWKLLFRQMEFVGVNSLFVVGLTALFTGMVLALQTYYAFRLFAAENLVGATVALSMTRELGPVITALMVTGRAGSAMAAEIGTMRVTEQIDALLSMGVSPIQFLVVPRVLAGLIMVPLLTILSDAIGIAGGYLVGVRMLGINHGLYVNTMWEMLQPEDVYNGLIKAAVFGVILTLVGCSRGLLTTGGAQGVGRATTQAVVLSSVLILMSDYLLTALMFGEF
jgi:phospholipid/cholesterol/gamma-HCH transport system permease protein